MTEKLSNQQMAQFREAFALFDRNSTGSIGLDDLGTVFANLGQDASEQELIDMINEVSTSGTAAISFAEFLTMMARSLKDKQQEDILRSAFDVLDVDQDNYIDATELRAVMEGLGETLTDAEYIELLKEVDMDANGRIDFNEFTRLMTVEGSTE